MTETATDERTAAILDRLNAYEGEFIWRDVIRQTDGFSESLTAVTYGHETGDGFGLANGVMISRRDNNGVWRALNQPVPEPESPFVSRPRDRAVEAATDAAIAIRRDEIGAARVLLAEAAHHLDTLEEARARRQSS